MKRLNREGNEIFAGTAREIRSLYKALVKNAFIPAFSEMPKFNKERFYGLVIPEDELFYVINETSLIGYLLEE